MGGITCLDRRRLFQKKGTRCLGADVLRRIGDETFDRGEYKKALECFIKILNQHPIDSSLLSHIATSYFYLGDFEKAKTYYLKLLDIDRDYTYIWIKLGLTLAKLGELDNAIEAIAKSLKNRSHNEGYLLKNAHTPPNSELINNCYGKVKFL